MRPGLSATVFPSGVRGSHVATTEAVVPVLVTRHDLKPNSRGPGEPAWQGRSADAALSAEGGFLRVQAGAGLPECLRATVGPEKDISTAAELLQHWAAKKMP